MKLNLIDYPRTVFVPKLTKEDFIFIALHGEDGESGELQKFYNKGHPNFSGSGYEVCETLGIKIPVKKFLRENNILTPNWISVPSLCTTSNSI